LVGRARLRLSSERSRFLGAKQSGIRESNPSLELGKLTFYQ
jgi:hypothetical protein